MSEYFGKTLKALALLQMDQDHQRALQRKQQEFTEEEMAMARYDHADLPVEEVSDEE